MSCCTLEHARALRTWVNSKHKLANKRFGFVLTVSSILVKGGKNFSKRSILIIDHETLYNLPFRSSQFVKEFLRCNNCPNDLKQLLMQLLLIVRPLGKGKQLIQS